MALLSLAPITVGSAQAHQKGDFIVRLGVTGTHVSDIPSERIVGGLATPALETRLIGLEEAINIDTEDLMARGWDGESVLPLRQWPLAWAGVNILSMENAVGPRWDMTWFMSDHLALDVSAAIYKHDIKMGYNGQDQETLRQVNGLKFAESKHEQLTLGLVYYPLGNLVSRIHPYIGLGTTYTKVTTSPHRDWVNFESARIDEALRLATAFNDDTTDFVGREINDFSENETARINAELSAGLISNETATLQRLLLAGNVAEDRRVLEEDVAEIRQAIADEGAEGRRLLEEDAARRTHFYSWKVNAKIGADFNLTDKFLISTQAGYTRVENVGYWNYLLGFGIKL